MDKLKSPGFVCFVKEPSHVMMPKTQQGKNSKTQDMIRTSMPQNHNAYKLQIRGYTLRHIETAVVADYRAVVIYHIKYSLQLQMKSIVHVGKSPPLSQTAVTFQTIWKNPWLLKSQRRKLNLVL